MPVRTGTLVAISFSIAFVLVAMAVRADLPSWVSANSSQQTSQTANFVPGTGVSVAAEDTSLGTFDPTRSIGESTYGSNDDQHEHEAYHEREEHEDDD